MLTMKSHLSTGAALLQAALSFRMAVSTGVGRVVAGGSWFGSLQGIPRWKAGVVIPEHAQGRGREWEGKEQWEGPQEHHGCQVTLTGAR